MTTTANNAIPDVDRMCAEAIARSEAGNLAEAYELLIEARRLAPQSPLVHYRIAILCCDSGRLGEALDALDAALQLDDVDPRFHNNRGSVLEQLGRPVEAEAAFRRAMELDPTLSLPYINLGHLLEQRGAKTQAVALYDLAIARGLDQAMFNQYRAAVSGEITRASPPSWVRATFDNFAPTFEVHLRALGYRVPQELAGQLLARAQGPLDILDLGCGTGLCGVALMRQKKTMVGVDLSEKMLQLAERRKVYDQLHVGEISDFLRASESSKFDVVIAADVFIYIGKLEELFRETARVLRPGGWFAFSTEERNEQDYCLLPTGRYAQSQEYIRRLAGSTFHVVLSDAEVIRIENGAPLPGRLYLLQKASST